ncbi:SseB family protein [Flavobacterium lacisediminis]|uniref:SseB family protein n=1 Tax=Flavobacterium lacisediminis TaxID=2989705 RepID=A0ABT3EKR3_9FLAO|nr:SseB family protein [Flavobacterium lacisediminis]MCW1149167.1 SseB family protein [Flavobacterium lacisediminis]
MKLFNKLLGKKEAECTPDNSVLLQLIQAYHYNKMPENYGKVIEELYGPRSFLFVPTADKHEHSNGWEKSKGGDVIDFATVYNLDGLLVLGVFTSEEALSKWTKEEMGYIAIPSKTIMEIAERENFGRVVIDSDQDTMFVLERNVSNSNEITIKEDTEVLIWYPKQPIYGAHKAQLCNAFSKVSSIKEVYHFGMTRNDEAILILAFLLDEVNENSRLAVLSAMNDGMNGFSTEFPLEMMYVKEGDDWHKTGNNFEVFYKR